MKLLEKLQRVKEASSGLGWMDEAKRAAVLGNLAKSLRKNIGKIIGSNATDLERMSSSDPKYDRLLLNDDRIEGMAKDVEAIAAFPDVLGKVLDERVRPNGLVLKKISVPLGVVGVIFESRPNVVIDVFSLCFKAGNGCVLKGGKEAEATNEVLYGLIHEALREEGVNTDVVYLLPNEREAVSEMLGARGLIDVMIPRGGKGLIDFVRENAKLPVIETGAGIVHLYFDEEGDLEKGKKIVLNAKTRRPAVCNSLDTLLVHEKRLGDLGELIQGMREKGVMIFADEQCFEVLEGNYDADLLQRAMPEHFGEEFLSLKMSIKVVADLDEALEHISRYGSKHSEMVVSENGEVCERFLREVDAAAVYANASSAFTDGGQFGMGGEIGISTQKLHARGPMGAAELCSYKWVCIGDGQVR